MTRLAARHPSASRGATFLPLLLLYVLISLTRAPSGPRDDETVYLFYAHQLIHGHYASQLSDVRFLWYGPGLPIVLAPLVAIKASLTVIRLVEPGALFLAVLAFYRLLRLYASSRLAVIGSYLFGVYPPLLVLSQSTFSEPLALLCATAGSLFTALAFRSGRRRYVFFAGIAFGWLALTEVAFGWVLTVLGVIAAGVWILARRRDPVVGATARRSTAIFAIALGLCLPWLGYTASVTDKPFYWGNSGGTDLYWMASPSRGSLGDWEGFSPQHAEDRPFFASLAGLSPSAKDSRIESEALTLIEAHPGIYVRNVGLNISRLLFEAPYSAKTVTPAQSAVYAIPNAIVLLLLALLAPSIIRARTRLPPEAYVFGGLAIGAFCLHALLSGEARMLVPLLPLVGWFIVYPVVALDALPIALRTRLCLSGDSAARSRTTSAPSAVQRR